MELDPVLRMDKAAELMVPLPEVPEVQSPLHDAAGAKEGPTKLANTAVRASESPSPYKSTVEAAAVSMTSTTTEASSTEHTTDTASSVAALEDTPDSVVGKPPVDNHDNMQLGKPSTPTPQHFNQRSFRGDTRRPGSRKPRYDSRSNDAIKSVPPWNPLEGCALHLRPAPQKRQAVAYSPPPTAPLHVVPPSTGWAPQFVVRPVPAPGQAPGPAPWGMQLMQPDPWFPWQPQWISAPPPPTTLGHQLHATQHGPAPCHMCPPQQVFHLPGSAPGAAMPGSAWTC